MIDYLLVHELLIKQPLSAIVLTIVLDKITNKLAVTVKYKSLYNLGEINKKTIC